MVGEQPASAARSRFAAAVIAGLAGLGIASCGSAASTISQANNQPQLTTAQVEIKPTGDPSITLVDGGTSFHRDDAGLLVMTVKVHSAAATKVTVVLRATLDDSGGVEIGTAGGGAVEVAPGADVPIQLTGRLPGESIASATVQIDATPSPTGAAAPTPAPTP
jgi:hypothetical protein